MAALFQAVDRLPGPVRGLLLLISLVGWLALALKSVGWSGVVDALIYLPGFALMVVGVTALAIPLTPRSLNLYIVLGGLPTLLIAAAVDSVLGPMIWAIVHTSLFVVTYLYVVNRARRVESGG